MYSLHRARFCAIFGFKFNSFMSSLTHSSHVFLGLPLQPFPSTLTFRQALTHSPHMLHVSKPTQSTSPHHLHHTLNTQTRAQVLTPLPLRQLHPHILLTIHISLRSS